MAVKGGGVGGIRFQMSNQRIHGLQGYIWSSNRNQGVFDLKAEPVRAVSLALLESLCFNVNCF